MKCRININYIDTPSNIQIKCRALTSYDDVPLAIVINFNDFHFERVEEVDGMKQNVFAITWSPQITENNEFFIAIDDRVQFVNYGTYLNNMIKICRIAEDGKSTSFFVVIAYTRIKYHFFCSASMLPAHFSSLKI